MQRRDLHVPYEEKDEAKALGAQWDAGAKRWYVPAGQPDAALERWFEPRAEVVPEDSDCSGLELNRVIAKPFIIHASVECWKCQRATPVLSVAEADDDGGLEGVIGILRVDELLAEALSRHPHYRRTYSKTTESWAFANICAGCASLQGDFYLHMEPDGPFFTLHARSGLLEVTQLPGPARVAIESGLDSEVD